MSGGDTWRKLCAHSVHSVWEHSGQRHIAATCNKVDKGFIALLSKRFSATEERGYLQPRQNMTHKGWLLIKVPFSFLGGWKIMRLNRRGQNDHVWLQSTFHFSHNGKEAQMVETRIKGRLFLLEKGGYHSHIGTHFIKHDRLNFSYQHKVSSIYYVKLRWNDWIVWT